MGRPERRAEPTPSFLGDLVSLGKPSITLLSVIMAAGGLALAGDGLGPGIGLDLVLATLLGTGLTVAAANALNMWLERHGDALMERTARRPLPAGRLSPGTALAFGLGTGALGLAVLWTLVNPITAWISAEALFLYVLVYTPLKRRTPLALLVGAVPGAAPPLMGHVAATGAIDAAGLVLFAILFVWQVPHFLAIALFRMEDYARAGIRTVPLVRGERAARLQALAYATALLPVSVALVPLGAAGWLYLAIASAAGIWFWTVALQGLLPATPAEAALDRRWPYRLFGASLVYLPVVVLGLALDRMVGSLF